MSIKIIARAADIFLLKVAVMSDPRLKQISLIPSFAGRIKFCSANFKKLISGSGRIAFEYTPELILKLAKNEKGIAQNGTESDGFLQKNYKELVANVIDSDPNDAWIISETASRVSEAEFQAITGVNFKNLCNYLTVKFNNGQKLYLPKVENEAALNDNNFVSDLMDMMANFNMPVGDIARIRSWGKIKNRVVLIDYGLTQDIFDQFYKK